MSKPTIKEVLNGRLPCSSLEQELIVECDDRDKRIEELKAEIAESWVDADKYDNHQHHIDRLQAMLEGKIEVWVVVTRGLVQLGIIATFWYFVGSTLG